MLRDRLTPPLVIRDLGCGTGSLGRWLAPRLPVPQTWILTDRDHDLLEIAADSVREAHARVPGRPVRLAALHDSDTFVPPTVLGDEHGLRQVATNLVANALQHTVTPAALTVGEIRREATRKSEVLRMAATPRAPISRVTGEALPSRATVTAPSSVSGPSWSTRWVPG